MPIVDSLPTNAESAGVWHDVGKKFNCWDSTCTNPNSCSDKDHIKWSKMMERATNSWRERYFACGSLEGYAKFREL